MDTVIDTACLLFDKSSNIHFFLIGDGTEKKKLIKKAQERAIDNITFIDPVSKFQVPSILQQSDLLIFCLRNLRIYKYGISLNKMYDYFASRKPVVMSGDASNNIIQEAKAGITVEPENSDALAKGILKIENMTLEERRKLGTNGRAYVEKYYNTRVLADILEKIL